MTEADLERAIAEDEDERDLDPDWTRAELVMPRPKQSVHLRLEREVVEFFKAGGKGHITRMQAVLRAYVEPRNAGQGGHRRSEPTERFGQKGSRHLFPQKGSRHLFPSRSDHCTNELFSCRLCRAPSPGRSLGVPEYPSMRHQQTVNIDLKRLSEIAHVGVRRAVLFMGLGLNAASREDFNDYQLYKLPIAPGQTSALMDFFPPDLPANRVAEFKQEFASWITGCGLRELLEHYAIFLDQIHRYSLLVYQVKGQLGSLDPAKKQRDFNRKFGVPRKLKTLRERFGIEPSYSESISQLYVTRNCLTHDLGIVSSKHCGGHTELVLTWRGLDLVAIGSESGAIQGYTDFIGRPAREGSAIALHVVDRERRFSIEQRIRLSQQDLAEICYFFVNIAIPTAVQSFVTFLKVNGIQVDGEAGAEDAAVSDG